MLKRYGALCEACDYRTDYLATYENRMGALPACIHCGDIMEYAWFGDAPHVTPERMWVEGTGAMRGRRVILNDSDDPWEGSGTNLCAEMSEEHVAKGKELLGKQPTNWGERKGTIVFDAGGGA